MNYKSRDMIINFAESIDLLVLFNRFPTLQQYPSQHTLLVKEKADSS